MCEPCVACGRAQRAYGCIHMCRGVRVCFTHGVWCVFEQTRCCLRLLGQSCVQQLVYHHGWGKGKRVL